MGNAATLARRGDWRRSWQDTRMLEARSHRTRYTLEQATIFRRRTLSDSIRKFRILKRKGFPKAKIRVNAVQLNSNFTAILLTYFALLYLFTYYRL